MTDVARVRRGRETVRDMGLSLGLCLVFVVGAVVLQEERPDDPVREVDYVPDVALADRVAAYDALGPTGLPRGWRATASRVGAPDRAGGPVRLEIGFVTPEEEYAAVVEHDAPRAAVLAEELGSGLTRLDAVDVAGTSWDQLRGPDDELALVRLTDDGATVVVHGTAGLGELRTLAAALR